MQNNFASVGFLKTVLHVGFFLSGIATMLIGQVLPIISNRFALNDLQVSFCFPAQFLGSVIGTLLTNSFGKRNKFLSAGAAGCFLMGLGVLLLNSSRFEICLVGFLVNGIGVGLTLPSINMLVFELNPLRATSAVNVLNFFWGLGAIICSLTILNFSDTIGFFPMSATVSLLLLTTAGIFWLIPKELERRPAFSEEINGDLPPIWSSPTAWMIAGFNFIHVGVETGISGWLPTYTQRVAENSYVWWLAPTFLYFLFFVLGRGAAPFFLRFLNENKMLLFSLLLMLGGVIIMLAAKEVLLLGIGASVAGFGTSSIFPNNMSRFNNTFGASASRRGTPFFLAGTLGAASTTLLIGFMSNQFNDLHLGMGLLLGSSLILIFLQIFLQFRQNKH